MQWVVLYRGTDRELHVYTTAYDGEQRKQAVSNCARRYGPQANVQIKKASEFWRDPE